MVNIYISMNQGSGSLVEVHREDCSYAQTIFENREGDDAGVVPHFTPVEIWEEYNLDFIGEAKSLGIPMEEMTWDVDIYPCTGLVTEMTTVTGYPEENYFWAKTPTSKN